MEESKPWYLSTTIIAALLVVIISVLSAFGVAVESIQAEQTHLADLIVQLLTAVAGLVAVYGRITAKRKIGDPNDDL